jgi:hypothetical protein
MYTIAWGEFIVQVDADGRVYLCHTGIPVAYMPFIAEGI